MNDLYSKLIYFIAHPSETLISFLFRHTSLFKVALLRIFLKHTTKRLTMTEQIGCNIESEVDIRKYRNEQGDSISFENACAPSEDSDQPAHPRSLIRVFAARLKTLWLFGYPRSALRRLIRQCGCAG